MKTLKLTLAILVILTGIGLSVAKAQPAHASGLYMTLADYLNHKLSYTQDENTKLRLNEFLGRKTITVITGGKKLILQKDQVFGYHDAAGHDYRFFDNAAYQVVDTSGFYLYSFDRLVQAGKGGPKPVRSMYFSIKTDAAILPLTEDSLDLAFAKNPKFRYTVEAQLGSDGALASYDNALNVYKIKEIYKESSK